MNAPVGRPSLRVVLLLGAVYLLVGVAFAEFAKWSSTETMRLMWRRLAWLVCGVAFAAHIAFELFRLWSSPRKTAMHASVAAALGSCGLAAAANVHGWLFASGNQRALGVALIAWPLLTAVPAFVVAMVAAAVLNRWRRRF